MSVEVGEVIVPGTCKRREERTETTEIPRLARDDDRGGREEGTRLYPSPYILSPKGEETGLGHSQSTATEPRLRRASVVATSAGRAWEPTPAKEGEHGQGGQCHAKSRNCKTNPSLFKPAWKIGGRKAKNEPKFRGVECASESIWMAFGGRNDGAFASSAPTRRISSDSNCVAGRGVLVYKCFPAKASVSLEGMRLR
jgi:hypothetical protein